MFDFIFEILAEIVGELILQIIGEIFANLLVSFFSNAFADTLRQPSERNPALSLIGYILFGIVLGAISLWIFPHYLLSTPQFRIANLIGSSLTTGWVMSSIGTWKKKRGKLPLPLDSFWYGFTFAFFFALIRLCLCTAK